MEKIELIKAIRKVSDCGLVQGKKVAETFISSYCENDIFSTYNHLIAFVDFANGLRSGRITIDTNGELEITIKHKVNAANLANYLYDIVLNITS